MPACDLLTLKISLGGDLAFNSRAVTFIDLCVCDSVIYDCVPYVLGSQATRQ